MLAILKAGEHKKPVPHFAKRDAVYRALLGIEEKVVVCRRSKALASDGCPDDFPVKATEARKAKKVKKVLESDEEPESESAEESISEEQSVSDSSTSSSSSSSSGSSDDNENKEPEHAEEAGDVAKKNISASFCFGPHLITPRPEGGYQLTCKHPDHKSTPKCTKTQAATASTGGDEGALRRLKFWATMANDCTSKAEHKAKWQWVVLAQKNGLLPFMEDLNAMEGSCLTVGSSASTNSGASAAAGSSTDAPPAKRQRVKGR